ncbi:ESX secretion-associated protein EspG [Rhodococcus sp. AG1013]|uniref:ESX secretion-associated protein EspG n=1 Tax=unclassified Rhodococcus (in: high G+C Gram-positive bacteria) TaxID=192944 RepID=UPI000E0AC451|nr:ESX secretion-associated protein EspG [Rhodococcus sp. AG1013]RDI16248.1 ESAT-6 protein secretion system EspG family protein [Rhodococcus sp. AG1013]
MIDLGIEPVTATLPSATLHVDELDLLVDLLDIDVLPVVLDAAPRFDSLPERDRVFRSAQDSLAAAGLIDGIAVHPELARWLRALARPRDEIALRRYIDGTVARLCLARDDEMAVLALRSGDTFTVQRLEHDLAGPIVHALGGAEPLAFGVVNRPTTDLGAALNRIVDPGTAAAQLTAIGVPAAEAAVVGPAFVGCTTFTEIVGIVHEAGHPGLMHGPVTVFDTAAGRIVGTTSVATDGTPWTSFSPGTPGRLRQALDGLLAQLD